MAIANDSMPYIAVAMAVVVITTAPALSSWLNRRECSLAVCVHVLDTDQRPGVYCRRTQYQVTAVFTGGIGSESVRTEVHHTVTVHAYIRLICTAFHSAGLALLGSFHAPLH